jgi:hypothetical protein
MPTVPAIHKIIHEINEAIKATETDKEKPKVKLDIIGNMILGIDVLTLDAELEEYCESTLPDKEKPSNYATDDKCYSTKEMCVLVYGQEIANWIEKTSIYLIGFNMIWINPIIINQQNVECHYQFHNKWYHNCMIAYHKWQERYIEFEQPIDIGIKIKPANYLGLMGLELEEANYHYKLLVQFEKMRNMLNAREHN